MEQVILGIDENGDVDLDSLVRLPRTSRHFLATGIYLENHKETTCLCSKCGDVNTIYLECGDRTCWRCQERRRKRIYKRYHSVVVNMENPIFLTLTLTRRALSAYLVSYLRKCFTKLRHRQVWKARGGIYQIEIGTIKEGTANIHIHAIIDSSWMDKSGLREAWHKITKDSYVIDIERCFNSRGALIYLTKHMGKRIGNIVDADLINDVLHGTRLVQGFGDLHYMSLGLRTSICSKCGGINTLYMDFEIESYKYPRDNVGF